jgi:long-chain fatty acid transport protein
MRTTIAITSALALLTAAGTASASGLGTARFGAEHGHPATTNPTALYYNPAGISAATGLNIYADGNLAWRIAGFEREASTSPDPAPSNTAAEPADAVGANYGEASLTNVAFAPMLGATLTIPAGDMVDIGIGGIFCVPFGGSSTWSGNDDFANAAKYPGASDGVQRWWAIDGYLRALYFGGGVSVGIADIFHIGVSAGAALSQVNTIRARELGGTDDVTQEGRAWLEASKVHPWIGYGVMVTPFDGRLRIGASHQLPPGITNVKLDGTLHKIDGRGNVSDDEVELHQHWPHTIRLGAAWRVIDPLEIRLHGEFQTWGQFNDQCLAAKDQDAQCETMGEDGQTPPDVDEPIINQVRNWQNAFAIRAGASYWFIDEVEGMIGAGYDSSAIPDENLDPAIMDFHDVSVAIGARVRPIDEIAVALTYTQFFYVPRDTTGQSAHPAYQGNSDGPDSGGKYTQTIGVVNVNAQVYFDVFDVGEPAGTEK